MLLEKPAKILFAEAEQFCSVMEGNGLVEAFVYKGDNIPESLPAHDVRR